MELSEVQKEFMDDTNVSLFGGRFSFGKSWIEKAIQEQLAAELTKNQLTYCGYIIDDFKAWMPRTKLLQSKGKCPRMVRVVIKY